MSVTQLIYKLGADSSGFSKELKSAEKSVQNFQKRAESNIRKIGKSFAVLGGAVAGALVGIVKQTIDTGNELSILSDKTGLAVEELSSLQWAATQAGVEQGKLEKGLQRFNRTIFEAASGTGRAAEAARRLGISLQDSNGNLRPQTELLSEVADAVANAANGYEEAAIASEFFGREAGPELLPLLKEGSEGINELTSEAERLGLVFSTDAAQASRQLKDDINLLRQGFTSFAVSITSQVVPVMGAYVGSLADTARQTENTSGKTRIAARIMARILQVVEGVRVTFVILGETLGVVGASVVLFVQDAIKQLKTLGTGVANLVRGIRSRDIGQIRSAWSDLGDDLVAGDEAALERQRELWSGYAGDIVKIVETSGERMAKILEAANEDTARSLERPPTQVGAAYTRAVDEIDKELERLRTLTQRELQRLETPLEEFQRRMVDFQAAFDRGIINKEEFRAIREELIKTLDPFEDLAVAAKAAAAEMQELQRIEELSKQADRVIASINGIDLAAVAHLETLQQLRDEGLITWQQYEQAVKKATTETSSLQKETGDFYQIVQSGASMAASSIADFVVDPLNQSFSEMADNFIRQVTRMVIETAVQRAILSGLSGVGGFSSGGEVQGFASGGFVSGPGTPTSDSIPAWLSDGEYVLSARTTKRVGIDNLNALNFGKAKGFAQGGSVGPSQGGGSSGVTIIPVMTNAEAMQRAMQTTSGQAIILQTVIDNADKIRGAM